MGKHTNWIAVGLVMLIMTVPATVNAEIVDRIVAIVNEDIITLVELNKATRAYSRKIEASGKSEAEKLKLMAELRAKMLDRLIDKSLTRQEAQRYHAAVSETELDDAIETFKRQKSLSQENLEALLAKDGISYEDYREGIRKQLLQSKIIARAVKSKVIVTKEEINTYYEENAARAIAEIDETIDHPAKVMRIGAMMKQLLDELRSADLDEPSRDRLREI